MRSGTGCTSTDVDAGCGADPRCPVATSGLGCSVSDGDDDDGRRQTGSICPAVAGGTGSWQSCGSLPALEANWFLYQSGDAMVSPGQCDLDGTTTRVVGQVAIGAMLQQETTEFQMAAGRGKDQG